MASSRNSHLLSMNESSSSEDQGESLNSFSQISRKADWNASGSHIGGWTDDKHSLYLNSIEEMFVRGLYEREYCSVDICGVSSPQEDDCVQSNPSFFKMLNPFVPNSWMQQHRSIDGKVLEDCKTCSACELDDSSQVPEMNVPRWHPRRISEPENFKRPKIEGRSTCMVDTDQVVPVGQGNLSLS